MLCLVYLIPTKTIKAQVKDYIEIINKFTSAGTYISVTLACFLTLFSHLLLYICSSYLFWCVPPLALFVSEQRWKIRSSWSTTCWIRSMRWSSAAAWPSPSSKSSTTWRWGKLHRGSVRVTSRTFKPASNESLNISEIQTIHGFKVMSSFIFMLTIGHMMCM